MSEYLGKFIQFDFLSQGHLNLVAVRHRGVIGFRIVGRTFPLIFGLVSVLFGLGRDDDVGECRGDEIGEPHSEALSVIFGYFIQKRRVFVVSSYC